ncbi:hypothetical protein F7725_005204 [Dissostichus mawsoni]|uniref:Uncharacterized protein n=1 Tax=Dissostichus mawsoni TaxID=36200 RepID=A0A7J5YT29_DISMA|nr:hypothetical protein F7725_005204 [Dissostichus mawsoni]
MLCRWRGRTPGKRPPVKPSAPLTLSARYLATCSSISLSFRRRNSLSFWLRDICRVLRFFNPFYHNPTVCSLKDERKPQPRLSSSQPSCIPCSGSSSCASRRPGPGPRSVPGPGPDGPDGHHSCWGQWVPLWAT